MPQISISVDQETVDRIDSLLDTHYNESRSAYISKLIKEHVKPRAVKGLFEFVPLTGRFQPGPCITQNDVSIDEFFRRAVSFGGETVGLIIKDRPDLVNANQLQVTYRSQQQNIVYLQPVLLVDRYDKSVEEISAALQRAKDNWKSSIESPLGI